MKRTRTEPRGWAAPLLASSLLLCAPLASTTARAEGSVDSAQRALAREHFAKGVALAKAHAYAEALSEFQQAYAAVPHFSVLYNIGQAKLALGDSAEAITALQRYLDEGGANIDAQRRTEVEATIARERELQPPPEPPSFVVGEAVKPPTETATATETATETHTAAPPKPAPPPPAASRPVKSAPRDRRTLAYAVGAAGVVLSGGALAHYLWNRGRYQDWQNQYSTYFRDPTEQNRNTANALAKSIDDASVLTVALAVGAGVALGTGGVLWLTSAPGSDPRHGRFAPFVAARGSF